MRKRILYALLSLVLIFTLCGSNCITSFAEVTEESIKAKEDQISSAKKERDSLKNAKTDLEKVKKELETSKSNLNSYITKIDASLTEVQSNIDSLNDQITAKESQIEKTSQELADAEEVQQNQYEAMKKRIKFMYECGDTMYMELLMKAGSFADMLNKAEAEYIKEEKGFKHNELS